MKKKNPLDITDDSDTFRVVRGGNWYSNAGYSHVSFRYNFVPRVRIKQLGFRICKTTKDDKE